MSHALSFTQPTSVRRGRSEVIALWVVQIALAGMFLLAGGSKLLGAPAMVTLFTTIGVGQWFRYVTGIIEVGSAIAAALFLITMMVVGRALAPIQSLSQAMKNISAGRYDTRVKPAGSRWRGRASRSRACPLPPPRTAFHGRRQGWVT